MKTPTLTETDALEYMREGRPLVRMHTPTGLEWYVVPGGRVSDVVAARILARRGVARPRRLVFELQPNFSAGPRPAP
jgi:hypothetical protein